MPPRTPTRAQPRHDLPDDDPAPPGEGKWIGWTVYTVLALIGFCFGAWAGNQKTRTIEVVKTVPAETRPEPKKEPEPPRPEKKEPEPPKKEMVAVKPPEPMTPEPKVTPEPRPPEPKAPEPKTPEPKKPEPKAAPAKVPETLFAKDVLPVFKAKCTICHGDSKGLKGDLDLRTLAAARKGGETGPAIKPGDLKNSLIWTTIEDGAMPPAGKPQLTDAEKTVIKNWILSGGK
jgi:outer membrane biosynthesis protein TonB